MVDKNKEIRSSRSIWVISGGRYVDTNITGLLSGAKPKFVKEYRISQLARYLLNPKPIEVKKNLPGAGYTIKKQLQRNPKKKSLQSCRNDSPVS